MARKCTHPGMPTQVHVGEWALSSEFTPCEHEVNCAPSSYKFAKIANYGKNEGGRAGSLEVKRREQALEQSQAKGRAAQRIHMLYVPRKCFAFC